MMRGFAPLAHPIYIARVPAWLQLLKRRGVGVSPKPKFGHGAVVTLDVGSTGVPNTLIGCYHPSRQNTNTGVLTAPMMMDVFRKARGVISRHAAKTPTL